MFILIGTGSRVTARPKSDELSPDLNVDTADFCRATIFSDSDYDGLGSWGDPKDDFQICTGGLKGMTVAYPVPHRIRRNYTLQPFLVGAIVRPKGAWRSRGRMSVS